MPHKLISVKAANKELSRKIAAQYGIPAYTAHLLVTRGILQEEEILSLLSDEPPCLVNPFDFADMQKAADRITRAIENCEKIAIYGDYDADGVTSSALLFSFLEMFDANAFVLIPDREKDGYGLSMSAVDKIHAQQATLIITVDNGVRSVEEIKYASSLGIDTVVTDHHLTGEVLPPAVAVVDPHRSDCDSGFKDYAGVGVVFKLVCALQGDEEFVLENYADIIALGTIADSVPLIGENRTLVKAGLRSIENRDRIGLDMLISAAGAGKNGISSSDVAYLLAPRINAAGRMGSADRAFRLLLSEDYDECRSLADELNSENADRQLLEKKIMLEIDDILLKNPSLSQSRVIVIAGEGWKKGVIGLFAGKLCERFAKPCFVISADGDVSHGSARSIEGFSLNEAMTACGNLLLQFGGHEFAAGFAISADNIDLFRLAINEYAEKLPDMPIPAMEVECNISPKYVNTDFVRAGQLLEPFGYSNPAPIVCLTNCKVSSVTHLSGGKHQKLLLTKDGAGVEALWFSVPDECCPFAEGDIVDAAAELSVSVYNGRESVSANVKMIKLSSADRRKTIEDERIFEKFCRNEKLSSDEVRKIDVNRADIEAVYRYLRKNGGFGGDTEVLFERLSVLGLTDYGKLLVVLAMMEEAGLIKQGEQRAGTVIRLCDVTQKVDIFECSLYKRIEDMKCGVLE
ncbi:MAG: single-stranded-DNA-specific exonuclease RecJ [Oscillospiraceae bacterium]|jgi:single-stranded-DNA-specific exonuclease|nr:single-stranded-DNA-specific exonuclease RecJ [Oscillospiraceae bacterium]